MPEEGWEAAQVYQLCTWTYVGLMHALMPVGISTDEIQSVCQMLRVPRDRWPSVLYAVQLMASAARPVLQRAAIPKK